MIGKTIIAAGRVSPKTLISLTAIIFETRREVIKMAVHKRKRGEKPLSLIREDNRFKSPVNPSLKVAILKLQPQSEKFLFIDERSEGRSLPPP